jgi:hypothetical protein
MYQRKNTALAGNKQNRYGFRFWWIFAPLVHVFALFISWTYNWI